MKHKFHSPLFLFLSLVFTITAFGQETQKPTRLLVMQDIVFPYKSADYEKVQKSTNEFLKKNNSGITWRCYQTDDFTYMYVIPFSDFSMVDSMFKAWDDKMKSFDQKEFISTVGGFVGTIDKVNIIVVKQNENSYKPKEPRLKPEEGTFLHWDFVEFIPGKESEIWKLTAEFKKLNADKGIKTPYNLFSVDFGNNANTIVMVTSAKDAVDFYTQNQVDEKMIGDSGKELDAKFWSNVKSFHHFNGKYRADLSIQ